MLPYIIIILIVVLCSLLDYCNINRDYYRNLLWLLLTILVLFAGTRFETGNDWYEYTSVFKRLPELPKILQDPLILSMFRLEPGYLLFNSIVKFFGGSIDCVFLISAAFTIIILFIVFKRYSCLCFLAVLLYMRYGYLQTNMMFVRQGIAISFFFYSLKYIQEKRFFKYTTLTMIATSFHTSAILTFPLYFILNKIYSNKYICYLIIFSLVLSFYDISKPLSIILPSFIADPIINYNENVMWGEMSGRFNFGFFEKITIAILCMYYRKRLNNIPYFNIFFNIFILSIVCYYAFFQMYIFQQRLSMLLQLATIPVIIALTYLIVNRQKVYITIFLALIVSFFFLKAVSATEGVYIPYKSWLF